MKEIIHRFFPLSIILVLGLGGCYSKSPLIVETSPSMTPLHMPLSTTPSEGESADETLQTDDIKLVADLKDLDIDSFYNQSYLRLWGRDPETVTVLGLADIFSQNNDQLTDISDSYILETQVMEKEILALLNLYDRQSMTADQQVTYDVFKWYLVDRVSSHEFMYNDYLINATVYCVHTSLLQLFTDYQPLKTEQDAKAYIARLFQVDRKMSQVVEGLNRRAEAGVILPSFLLSWVTQEINQIAQSEAQSTPYYRAFYDKTKIIPGLSEQDRTQLLEEAKEAIYSSVLPGYKKLVLCLSDQSQKATNDAGVWKFPNGKAYYAYTLRHYTTTGMNADQIHALGKEQLDRIHADMRVIFDQLGYPQNKDLPGLFEKVAQDSGMVPGDEMVSVFEGLISNAETLFQDAFDIRPKAKVIVQGAELGGYYMPPAVDGSRSGIFYATISSSVPKFNMPSLLYHETVPGHHYQIAISQEMNLLPLRRALEFTGYTEGWALYAERLMSELGAYKDDPYGDLGRLQYEAFRAARLVVDTGIHDKKWSYDKALEFMLENTGLGERELQYEISRYIVLPGQATAYDVGFIKILELRQKAKETLGDKFDLKEFHNVLLSNGALPLEILEKVVDNYIQQEMNS